MLWILWVFSPSCCCKLFQGLLSGIHDMFHGHPMDTLLVMYIALQTSPSDFMCGYAREELGWAEVLEHFLSSVAIKMLGCLCLQQGVQVGIDNRALRGFPSATFTQKPGIANFCSSWIAASGDKRMWRPILKALFFFSCLGCGWQAAPGSLPSWPYGTK